MNIFPAELDVLVLGAGPAGVCCALRLKEMGNTVGLLESEIFPRAQIGESLSPGIRNIFEYLRADHLLENEAYLHHVPASIIWEQRRQVYQHPEKLSGGIIVDRSILDSELLKLAVSRGLSLLQPALADHFHFTHEMWHVQIKQGQNTLTVKTKVILDARGRKGTLLNQRFHTAPSSVAIWTHVPAQHMPFCTLVEVIREGWFWGSPVTEKMYRIMAFCDGAGINGSIMQHFEQLLQQSELLKQAENYLSGAVIETCSTTSYTARQPWLNQFIKTGEAAFAIDPLSSSGVEKAMRFSLQTAIAINTLLKTGDETLAKGFYEEKLIESIVHHTHWTAGYYNTAWAAKENNDFWMLRKSFVPGQADSTNEFLQNLIRNLALPPTAVSTKAKLPVDLVIQKLGSCTIQIAKDIDYKTMYGVKDDLVQIIPAIHHPSLSTPISFIEDLPLLGLLLEIDNKTISEAENQLKSRLTAEKTKKIIVFLWQNELINFK
ncbi:MAG: NAD(P)/FAD-dependent oxidoreductase [Sediminibacterium sp.]